MLVLKKAVNTCNGYCNVVGGGGGEDLSHQNIFDSRIKSIYLITAYELALKPTIILVMVVPAINSPIQSRSYVNNFDAFVV